LVTLADDADLQHVIRHGGEVVAEVAVEGGQPGCGDRSLGHLQIVNW
jgi:hypothetical protein